jgi:hypothetical protein
VLATHVIDLFTEKNLPKVFSKVQINDERTLQMLKKTHPEIQIQFKFPIIKTIVDFNFEQSRNSKRVLSV